MYCIFPLIFRHSQPRSSRFLLLCLLSLSSQPTPGSIQFFDSFSSHSQPCLFFFHCFPCAAISLQSFPAMLILFSLLPMCSHLSPVIPSHAYSFFIASHVQPSLSSHSQPCLFFFHCFPCAAISLQSFPAMLILFSLLPMCSHLSPVIPSHAYSFFIASHVQPSLSSHSQPCLFFFHCFPCAAISLQSFPAMLILFSLLPMCSHLSPVIPSHAYSFFIVSHVQPSLSSHSQPCLFFFHCFPCAAISLQSFPAMLILFSLLPMCSHLSPVIPSHAYSFFIVSHVQPSLSSHSQPCLFFFHCFPCAAISLQSFPAMLILFSLLPMCSHLSPVRPQFCYTSKLPDFCRQYIFSPTYSSRFAFGLL